MKAAQLVVKNLVAKGQLQPARRSVAVLGRSHVTSSATTSTATRSLWNASSCRTVVRPSPSFWSESPQNRWLSDSTKPEEEEEKKEEVDAEKAAEAEEPTTEEAAAAADAPPPSPSREEELEQKVKDLENLHLRALAEQENIRRIAARDVEASKQFAIKSFAKSLLDVSDNLTRALEAVPEEARHDKSSDASSILANLYEGIELTDRGLTKAFEMNGLVKFGKADEVFDPNQHQALYEYVDPEKKPGTIGQVMKPGFMLRERVLRPAEVGVVKEG